MAGRRALLQHNGQGGAGQACNPHQLGMARNHLGDLARQQAQFVISANDLSTDQFQPQPPVGNPIGFDVRRSAIGLACDRRQELVGPQPLRHFRHIGIEEQVIDRHREARLIKQLQRCAARQDIGRSPSVPRQDRCHKAATANIASFADQNALMIGSEMLKLHHIDLIWQPIRRGEQSCRRAIQHHIVFQESRVSFAARRKRAPGFAMAERAALIAFGQNAERSFGGEMLCNPSLRGGCRIDCGDGFEGQSELRQLRRHVSETVPSPGKVNQKKLHVWQFRAGVTRYQRTFWRSPFENLLEAVAAPGFEINKYKVQRSEWGIQAVDSFDRYCDGAQMAAKRALIQRCVGRRNNTASISIASPSDFLLGQRSHTDRANACFLPYCFDVIRRRALYVSGTNVSAAQGAPFYYLKLRRHAEQLLSVPIEHGPLTGGVAGHAPVFLFSPGRVGSTLISQVLAEAGVPSVSEPDFYTQAASPFLRSPLNPWRDAFQAAMWNLTHDLGTALGGAPVIKLRAECARAPELFVRSPEAKTIVLFRGFESWSRSTAQVFGPDPAKTVRKYWSALACYEKLARQSRCYLMRYEDWVHDPLEAAAALGRFLDVTIAPQAAQRALQSHSQQGTPLRDRVLPGWEAKWADALALWGSPRLVTARARLQIPPVWD